MGYHTMFAHTDNDILNLLIFYIMAKRKISNAETMHLDAHIFRLIKREKINIIH